MIVPEQSHVLNCHVFCILNSKVTSGFVARLFDFSLFLFSDFRSYALKGDLFRFGLVRFSESTDSTASVVIFVRIGFQSCDNLYLAGFVLPGQAKPRCCVSYHG